MTNSYQPDSRIVCLVTASSLIEGWAHYAVGVVAGVRFNLPRVDHGRNGPLLPSGAREVRLQNQVQKAWELAYEIEITSNNLKAHRRSGGEYRHEKISEFDLSHCPKNCGGAVSLGLAVSDWIAQVGPLLDKLREILRSTSDIVETDLPEVQTGGSRGELGQVVERLEVLGDSIWLFRDLLNGDLSEEIELPELFQNMLTLAQPEAGYYRARIEIDNAGGHLAVARKRSLLYTILNCVLYAVHFRPYASEQRKHIIVSSRNHKAYLVAWPEPSFEDRPPAGLGSISDEDPLYDQWVELYAARGLAGHSGGAIRLDLGPTCIITVRALGEGE